jgi:hypothetical protein
MLLSLSPLRVECFGWFLTLSSVAPYASDGRRCSACALTAHRSFAVRNPLRGDRDLIVPPSVDASVFRAGAADGVGRRELLAFFRGDEVRQECDGAGGAVRFGRGGHCRAARRPPFVARAGLRTRLSVRARVRVRAYAHASERACVQVCALARSRVCEFLYGFAVARVCERVCVPLYACAAASVRSGISTSGRNFFGRPKTRTGARNQYPER